MIFQAEIMKDVSFDPYYKIRFLYETDDTKIEKGYVEIFRKSPKSEIIFDLETNEKLNDVDKSKLELELLNMVVNHLFSKRSVRSSSLQPSRG